VSWAIRRRHSTTATHRFPNFLPDGRHFLYVRGSHSAANQDAVNSIWVGDLESDETVELIQSGTQAVYSQGHLFWVREGFLMARAFSADRRVFTGEPFAVGEDVVVQADSWRAAYAVSEAGPLAFHTGLAPERVLTWFDGEGGFIDTIGDPGLYSFIRLSPDDRLLAVTLGDANTGRNDIWVFDVERKVGSRLTFHESNDGNPVWSPDGARIVFASLRNGPADIYVRPANGRGDAEPLYASEHRTIPEDWSPDGKFVAFNQGVGKYDQWMLPLDGGEPFAFITGDFDEGYGRFSPDGNWFAYISNETGRYEMYLTRFPSGDGKWQLSKVGADWLLGWHETGNEIYYLDIEGKVCSVRVELADNVVAELPSCRFEAQANRTWDVLSDGKRFVLGVPDDVESDFPITLVLNWDGTP
jgi:Tol biopolymer transport system component